MDMPIDLNARFAIGQPVSRKEDPVLLRGEGRYSDDLSLPGQAYGVIVRSRHAHGILREVQADAARAMPGVLGIYTAADLVCRRDRPDAGHRRQAQGRHAHAEAASDGPGRGTRPLRG